MKVEQFYFRPTFGPVLAQKLKNKIFPPSQKKFSDFYAKIH